MDVKSLFKRQHDLVLAYQAVFDDESLQSRKVIFDLMKFTNMLQPSHVGGDAHASAFEEGKRAVMLYVLQKLQVSPDELYDHLMQASKQETMNE